MLRAPKEPLRPIAGRFSNHIDMLAAARNTVGRAIASAYLFVSTLPAACLMAGWVLSYRWRSSRGRLVDDRSLPLMAVQICDRIRG